MKKEKEIKKQESREQEYLEGWKRARADLENAKKRMADSVIQQRASIKRDIVEHLLSLADNFKSLVDHAPKEQDAWVQGVVHVARQFEQTLTTFGVKIIHETGGEFDPNIHEAVEEIEGDEKPGIVKEIVQIGYKIGDITIRPAKVKVTAMRSSLSAIGDPSAPPTGGVDSRLPTNTAGRRGNDNENNY